MRHPWPVSIPQSVRSGRAGCCTCIGRSLIAKLMYLNDQRPALHESTARYNHLIALGVVVPRAGMRQRIQACFQHVIEIALAPIRRAYGQRQADPAGDGRTKCRHPANMRSIRTPLATDQVPAGQTAFRGMTPVSVGRRWIRQYQLDHDDTHTSAAKTAAQTTGPATTRHSDLIR